MLSFTDTETSDPKEQRIVELACLLTDPEGREVREYNVLIKPDGWTICDFFTNEVHGISTAMCEEKGVPIKEALEQLTELLKQSKLFVGHNSPFDLARLEFEYCLLGLPNPAAVIPSFCTMRSSTDICKIPKARGLGYKWPKLTEAYRHFFGVDFADAHRAISDSKACKEIYFQLCPPVKPAQSSAAAAVSEEDFSAPPI